MTELTIDDFGKDHWSLLAYIKTRCVDYQGVLDIKHMRTKNPALVAVNSIFGPQAWKPEYGTRLSGYFLGDGKTDKSRQLPDHDDHDCQEDFERLGLVENMGSGLHPAVKLTKAGLELAAQVDAHKANGGVFANFKPEIKEAIA